MIEKTTVTRTYTISIQKGLHARPATKLAKTASQFDAEMTISKDGQEVNAKSVISILILAASCGSEVTIAASGPEAPEALEAVTELFNVGFNES